MEFLSCIQDKTTITILESIREWFLYRSMAQNMELILLPIQQKVQAAVIPRYPMHILLTVYLICSIAFISDIICQPILVLSVLLFKYYKHCSIEIAAFSIVPNM